MITLSDTNKANKLKALFDDKKNAKIGGWTGDSNGVVPVQGANKINVTAWDGKVYQVANDSVGLDAGLPVWIGPDPLNDGVIKVLGVRQVYQDAHLVSGRAHGNTHTWPGSDWHYVAPQQFTPGLVWPYTDGTFSAAVNVVGLPFQNTYREWKVGESRILDLTADIPVSGACWALIYYDSDGLLQTTISGTVADKQALTTDDIPTNDNLSLAAVKLYAGMTRVKMESTTNEYDIVDLRWGRREENGGPINADYIAFNTSYATTDAEPQGYMFWDADNHTATLVLENGVRLQVGQEGHFWAVNKTGSTIPNGSPVYIAGVHGNRPKIALAKGDADTTGHVAGVTTQAIADNAEGYVTWEGVVNQIDLSAFADGDELWVSKTTAGQMTATEPAVPHHADRIGFVLSNHATQGKLLVKIDRHLSIEELSDVDGGSPAADDLLQYDGSKWTPQSPTELGIMQNIVYRVDTTHALPAATGSGATYRIIARDGATVTIDPDGTDTIAGDNADFVLYDGEDIILSDTNSGAWE